jgi:hypothetical protein
LVGAGAEVAVGAAAGVPQALNTSAAIATSARMCRSLFFILVLLWTIDNTVFQVTVVQWAGAHRYSIGRLSLTSSSKTITRRALFRI